MPHIFSRTPRSQSYLESGCEIEFSAHFISMPEGQLADIKVYAAPLSQ
jgi:hypothetical protein